MGHPGEGLFDMAEDGAIKPAPLLHWACTDLVDTFVLLRIRYARSSAELRAGGATAQMTMSPGQALELADALRTRAEAVLNQRRRGQAD